MVEIAQIEERAVAIPEKARSITVRDDESLNAASSFLASVKALRKEIAETFDPMIKKAHEAHREALSQKKRFETPLLDGEKIVKRTIADYMEEQERIRRDAEAQRRRAIAEIECKKREEEERALEEALKAEEEGRSKEAAEILDKAEAVIEKKPEPVVKVPEKPAMTHGTSIRKIWKWEIVDVLPNEYLMPNEKKIAEDLRKSGYKLEIPGVHVYQESLVVAR